MSRKCRECSSDLVTCNKDGTPNPKGTHQVCPMARAEQTKEEFARPYRLRLHTHARIEELPETARARRSEKQNATIPMFDAPLRFKRKGGQNANRKGDRSD